MTATGGADDRIRLSSPTSICSADFADIRAGDSTARLLLPCGLVETCELPVTIDTTPALTQDYWTDTRRPLTSLLFLLPWIALYEVGILMLSQPGDNGLRNGADYWLRSLLSLTGSGQILLPPLLVITILLSWHLVRRYPWTIRLETQIGMLAESLLLAIALVAVGQLHHLLFVNLHTPDNDPRLLTVNGPMTHAVSYIGAGVYEEVLFRLLLVPAAFGFFRVMEFPSRWAAGMSAITTSFVFALAHHIGPAADAFNLFTFSFRAAAGIFFAGVFFVRGFGITVGCHAAYDLLVGVFLATEA